MDSQSRLAADNGGRADISDETPAAGPDPEPPSGEKPSVRPSAGQPVLRGKSPIRRALRRASGFLGLAGEPDQDPLRQFLNGRAQADGQAKPPSDKEIDEESRLLQNVMQLRDLRVEDVMVPRADIVSVESHASLDEVLAAFREGAHSRLPVYRETLDDPIGVVHLKDLALSHGFGAGNEGFSLVDHLRSALAVPASMKVRALLERMQASRRHMALVIDEYGGVDGLVTIEDIIEQIVGAIEDEHDDAEGPLWRKQPDGAYLAEARAYVDDFQEAAGATLLLEDWEEDVDTLGGLVFMICGRVPERGEVIRHPLGHEFEIVDADPRRIKRVRVRLAEPEEAADAATAQGASIFAAAVSDPGEPQGGLIGPRDDRDGEPAELEPMDPSLPDLEATDLEATDLESTHLAADSADDPDSTSTDTPRRSDIGPADPEDDDGDDRKTGSAQDAAA